MTDHNDPEFSFDKTTALSDPGAEMTSNPPRSDSQPLTAPARPLAPDAPNGLTSGPEASYAGVIQAALLDTIVRLTRERDAIAASARRQLPPNADSWQRVAEDLSNDLTEARATIARMRTGRP